MVESLSGWVVFLEVVSILVMILVLTFSNMGKDEKK
jgi:hypothetical protein